jgi:putative hydrolase of the HAD superfamily
MEQDTIKGIAFDLDNTLYPWKSGLLPRIMENTIGFWMKKYNITRQEYNERRGPLKEKYGSYMKGFMKECPNFTYEEYATCISDGIIYEDFLSQDNKLKDMLNKIKPSIQKYIVSNSPMNHIQQTIKALGIESCFDGIISLCDFNGEHCKPDKIVYETLAKKTNIPLNQWIMVDDCSDSLNQAKQLRMKTVHICWPFNLSGTCGFDHCENGLIHYLPLDMFNAFSK